MIKLENKITLLIAVFNKKMIDNIKFTYLDNKDTILFQSDDILVKREMNVLYEIIEKTELTQKKFYKDITKILISFRLLEKIDILLEVSLEYILKSTNVILFSSFYFNEFCKEIDFVGYSSYNHYFKNLQSLPNVKYDVGYIDEKSEGSITLFSKPELPLGFLSPISFIKKLEMQEKYYEHYLFL